MWLRMVARLLLLLIATAPPAVQARAPDASPRVGVMPSVSPADAGYVLTRWSARDGLPSAHDYLGTDARGILAFASQRHIHRFDGARFTRVDHDDGSPLVIESIMGVEGLDDVLWVASRNGELFRIGHHSIERFDAASGLPADTEFWELESADGRMLAATNHGLYQLRGSRWHPVAAHALADTKVWAMRFDGRAWWVIAGSRLLRMDAAMRTVETIMPLADDVEMGLVGNADTGVWLWSTAGKDNFCRLDAQRACMQLPRLGRPEIGPDGVMLWVDDTRVLSLNTRAAPGFDDHVLHSIETGEALDELTIAPDGTVWLIAGGRLLRLTPASARKVAAPVGGLLAREDGSIWLASFNYSVRSIAPPLPSTDPRPQVLPHAVARPGAKPTTIVRIDPGREGRAWIGTLTPPAIWVASGDAGWTMLPPPPLGKGAVIRGIAEDSRGRIIVGVSRDPHGLHIHEGGQWRTHAWAPASPKEEVMAIHVDRADRLWVSQRSGTVVVLEDAPAPGPAPDPDRGSGSGSGGGGPHPAAGGARVQHYRAPDDSPLGPIRAFHETDDGMWVVGLHAIARATTHDLVPLRMAGNPTVSGFTGMAFDDTGTLWLGAAQGVVRITRSEWQTAIHNPAARAHITLLDESRGVDHPIISTAPIPSMVRAADGAIWAATTGGTYRIVPHDGLDARSAPHLVLTDARVDDVPARADAPLALPAGARHVSIGFRPIDPVVPGRTLFRYRLQGLDDDAWLGARDRVIALERIPPGDYVLQVQASAEDGRWHGEISTIALTVPPTFLQSMWAIVVLAACVGGGITATIMLIGRGARRRARALAAARSAEREQVARDLHDTLLQASSGLLLTVQAATRQLGEEDPARPRLQRAIEIAERVIIEGRDRISLLRSGDPADTGLVHDLQRHAHDLARDSDVVCEVQIDPPPRALHADVADHVLQIAREALANALQHAHARHVRIRLTYADDALRLSVADDGIGMDAAQAQRVGHWGLLGMRERAASIGGTLRIAPADGHGVIVTLDVPARRAYPRMPRRPRPRWRSLFPGRR